MDARPHLDPATRRSVGALLASVMSSSSASLAITTALGKQVYDLTHRELDLGLLGLAEFAPAALLVLVTGSVADRLDRRTVAAVAAGAEGVVALGLAIYAASEPTSVGPIFLLVIAFGTARAFAAPAARSLPADILTAERLPWLVARYSASWQIAIVIGPLIGGVLYGVDPSLSYLASTVLLALAAASLLAIRVPVASGGRDGRFASGVAGIAGVADGLALEAAAVEPALGHGAAVEAPPATFHHAVEGLRFVRRSPVLLGAISLDLFAVLFGGAVALLPAIVEDRLGVGAAGLGGLRAAGGLGAAMMTALLAFRPVRQRVGRTLLFAVGTFGVGTIALGLTRNYAIAFVAMAVLSAADAISVFIRATLVPLVTPNAMRGRVLAVENVFIGASNELGAFESGVTGHLFGAVGAIVLGGAATIAIAGGWWFFFPGLRDTDRFPGGDVDENVDADETDTDEVS